MDCATALVSPDTSPSNSKVMLYNSVSILESIGDWSTFTKNLD